MPRILLLLLLLLLWLLLLLRELVILRSLILLLLRLEAGKSLPPPMEAGRSLPPPVAPIWWTTPAPAPEILLLRSFSTRPCASRFRGAPAAIGLAVLHAVLVDVIRLVLKVV